MDDSEELVCLRIFDERTQAELVKAYLEAHGIDVMLRADDAGGMLPTMTANVGRPCVMVRVKDAAEAKELLKHADDEKLRGE
ncbi:MAG: hypothetical protein GF404_12990 [candidate division Zixibacteria bacterium]|jgi:hypothetical protein|nr:hypothetical protein [candidate division Zixibacteria bacterium]